MTRLPRQARDGLMRAWLEILKERHPEVTWIAQDGASAEESVIESTGLVESLAA